MTKEERRTEILRLKKQGLKAAQVAQEVGCSIGLAYTVAKEAGEPFRNYSRPKSGAPYEEQIIELRKQGLRFKEIAEKLGVTYVTVSKWAYRHGVGYTEEELKNTPCSIVTEKYTEEQVAQLIESFAPGFSYIGGYTGSDGKVRIKCKKCGAETSRCYNSVRRGVCKCRACAKAENERQRQDLKNREAEERAQKREAEERAQKRELEQAIHLNEFVARCGDFEYVGDYTGSNGTARIRCTKCGTETIRAWVTVRHRNVKCEVCSKREAEERQRQREEEQERKRREAEAEKERTFWSRPTEQKTFKVCVICGELFVPRSDIQTTCSLECTKKKANRKDRRIQRMKTLTKDKDITLESLFRRDRGTCYLCGGQCDWGDMEYNENGAFIAGNYYPSVDHVMPLSKGGLHSWDNVRLAHRICNTRKRDSIYIPLV